MEKLPGVKLVSVDFQHTEVVFACDAAAVFKGAVRGATTIREQLEKCRADPACAGCHAKTHSAQHN